MPNISLMVFVVFYVIFCFFDLKNKKISSLYLLIYFIIAILINVINYYELSGERVIDIICSIMLSLVLFLISITTKESIGKGDCLYFFINSFYLEFKNNFIMLITGILVSFVISIIVFLYMRIINSKIIKAIPFLPCLSPYILLGVICIQ